MNDKSQPRRTGLRNLIIFQLKLAADALRDLLCSPLSVFLFILDAVQRNPPKDSHFARLMVWGARSDRFINLFGDHEQQEDGLDAIIERTESSLKRAKSPNNEQ